MPSVRATLEERLRELHAGICEVLAQTQPDLVVIEDLYSNVQNPRTALQMGHARGVLCLASAQAGVAVHSLGHARVKRALVGSGSARKEQVGAMVARLLGLRRPPEPHDVSDALALALAYLTWPSESSRSMFARISGIAGGARRQKRRVIEAGGFGYEIFLAAVRRARRSVDARRAGDAEIYSGRQSRRQYAGALRIMDSPTPSSASFSRRCSPSRRSGRARRRGRFRSRCRRSPRRSIAGTMPS